MCPELLALVSSHYELHLGRGESLPLDRALIHNVLEELNNKKSLKRFAVKSVKASRALLIPYCAVIG